MSDVSVAEPRPGDAATPPAGTADAAAAARPATAPFPRGLARDGAPAGMGTSCVVRARDFREPWFAERARELAHPMMMHRKLWEFCVIAQVAHEHLSTGARALGFGVGLEPLAAWFAARGADVVATDRPDETAEWDRTNQHARSLEQLRHPDVCAPADFEARVRFRPVDMNDVPADLRGGTFDFTWSAGSFEHIGGIDAGLDFFCRQMECLRPGGLAVHTTEFNMFSYLPTMESPNLVLFRVQELQVLAERLMSQGDALWPLDLASGIEPDDLYIDSPPWRLPHLKLALGEFTTTSVLLVARRGGA